VSSAYDDRIWRVVPDEPGPPPSHLVAFVRGLPRVERALDLGCGDGRLTRELRAGRVTGADVSAVALERARRRLAEATLVLLDPSGPLPMEDDAFELVVCAETIEHVQDVQGLLSEARRVLRPGGILALTTPAHRRLTGLRILVRGFEHRFDPLSPHLRFFTARSLASLLDATGFETASLRRERGSLLATARAAKG
jgi:SAM-dependent methyltransferase